MFGDVKGQEEDREYREFIDQHGRLYHTQVEKKTGDPCQALRPINWSAPTGPAWFRDMLLPPEDLDIMTMVPKKLRARRRYDIHIDYERWLSKWDLREQEHQQKLEDFARGMSKQANIIEILRNPPAELLTAAGPGPFPPREFIVACAAGDDWALGLTDRIPRKAQPLLDLLAPRFAIRREDRRTKNLLNPFADDDGIEDDDMRLDRRRPAPPNPLADEEDDEGEGLASRVAGEELERQFDPEAEGGRKVPPQSARAGGKGGKHEKTKPGTKKDAINPVPTG